MVEVGEMGCCGLGCFVRGCPCPGWDVLTGFGLGGVVVFKLGMEVGVFLITSESDPVALRRMIFLAVSCRETLCRCGASESLLFVTDVFTSLTARCLVSAIFTRGSVKTCTNDSQHGPDVWLCMIGAEVVVPPRYCVL